MTIMRIYQGFRSAPIGASSIPASIYQTAAYASPHLGLTFGFGLSVGTGIAWLLANFAPDIYDAIGGTLAEMLERLRGATGIPISQAQETAAYDFHLAGLADTFEQTGGDYGAVDEWSVAAGYGGFQEC